MMNSRHSPLPETTVAVYPKASVRQNTCSPARPAGASWAAAALVFAPEDAAPRLRTPAVMLFSSVSDWHRRDARHERLHATPYRACGSGVSEEETDYGPMMQIENINGLHHAIGLHIVEKEEPMNGSEFRFLRKQMRLTQSQLAKEFSNISDQTIANYEKGKTALVLADALMRERYLRWVLPAETRIEAINLILQPT
jgi:DNA-binding transcriptional regulator YiaG